MKMLRQCGGYQSFSSLLLRLSHQVDTALPPLSERSALAQRLEKLIERLRQPVPWLDLPTDAWTSILSQLPESQRLRSICCTFMRSAVWNTIRGPIFVTPNRCGILQALEDGRMPLLEHLELKDSTHLKLAEDLISRVIQACASSLCCLKLGAANCPGLAFLTDELLDSIARSCLNLQELAVVSGSAADLRPFAANCHKLHTVRLHGTSFDRQPSTEHRADESMSALAVGCQLRVVELDYVYGLTDACLGVLAQHYTRCNPWNDAGCKLTVAQTRFQLHACTTFDQTPKQRCGTPILDGARGPLVN